MSTAFAIKALVAVLVLCLLAVALSVLLPEQYLAFLESIPAKRFLTCALAVITGAAAVVVYYVVVLPTPARLTMTALWAIVFLFGPAIIACGWRPEKLTWVYPSGSIPVPELEFRGYDCWTAVLTIALLFFVWVIVYKAYPEQYKQLSQKPAGSGEPHL